VRGAAGDGVTFAIHHRDDGSFSVLYTSGHRTGETHHYEREPLEPVYLGPTKELKDRHCWVTARHRRVVAVRRVGGGGGSGEGERGGGG